ncbi:efflux transporter outer membrane subunit [Pasteurella multocida]|uniref:efflux transporter outer membrane subunit n=1 Tax=Pasteurella multocida TaxID=747 RepID=UPI000E01CDD5|nr:TolC family protein [Pasteurella multocida]MDY0502236.1 TolC family protein [Pasteurella multocida]MDY0634087.1 TolC family protein [Pasteurella multocida]MDY0692213.1 TolC family protein [Pasteurella multocida]SUB38959.1 cation efflux system protein CusC [Pasteurella multocida]HDR0634785.1 TolC family protein [Pasteurella multocida]
MQKTMMTFLLSSMLLGCQQTEVDLQSNIQLPDVYQYARLEKGAPIIQNWWESWQDPQLSRLIQQGLAQNHQLAIAKSKIQEAQAIVKIAQSTRFPTIAALANSGKSHLDIEQIDITPSGVLGGIRVAWEPDIFGQKRSDTDAAQATVLGAQQQFYAAQILVASEIAHYYLQALHNKKQQALLQRTQMALKALQNYIEGRFNAGQASAYERNEIKIKRHSLAAKQAILDAQFIAAQNAIAVLIGETPQHFKLDIGQMQNVDILSHLPRPPKGIQPADLLHQRPDIQAQTANVKAYAAKLASAKADLFPRFTLDFLWQTGRIKLDADLPTLQAWQNVVSAGIQLPIFTAGRIQANIQASDERLQQALLQYDRTLLQALAEVENHYQQQFSLTQQARLLTQASRTQQQQIRDTQKLFQYGDYTFDRVLQARLDALTLEEKQLENQLACAMNLVLLYKAIGVGWQSQ